MQIAELDGRPVTCLAHGIGGVRDLPVPDLALLLGRRRSCSSLSFVALGALWRRPLLERHARRPAAARRARARCSGRPSLRVVARRDLRRPARARLPRRALLGEPNSAENLAPTFVYVVFWLGLVPLSGAVRQRLARCSTRGARSRTRSLALASGSGSEWTPLARPARAARASGPRRSCSSASRRSSSPTATRRARARWRSRSRSTAT